MSEFTPLREAVDTLVSRSPSPDFGELKRRANRRGRRRVVMVAAATAAVIAGSAVSVTGLDDYQRTTPVEQPKPVVGAVPVWYDAQGLHRGDVVEQTPVDIDVLALVRSGAVYVDDPVGDVWFHPWGGEPRIVGHSSEAGPGGDPNGDIAVWFEGSDANRALEDERGRDADALLGAGPGELVVYDTVAGREISRTMQSQGVAYGCCQILAPGNEFLQVSAERVVWSSGSDVYSHDVRSRTTSRVNFSPMDVHDQIEVYFEEEGQSVVLRVPGRADERLPGMHFDVRLSPSGAYLLAVDVTETPLAAVIIDTRTGELWRLPKSVHPNIAWSYGDIAMVDQDGTRPTGARGDVNVELLACDAARRTCEPLPAERGFLLPTN